MGLSEHNKQLGVSFGTKKRKVQDLETGQVFSLEQKTSVDYGGEFYKKVYTSFFDVCFDMAKTATMKVLFYFLVCLKRKSCTIVRSVEQIVQETGFSRAAVFAALKELEERDFVAKTMPGVWMINPEMISDLDDVARYGMIRQYRTIKENSKGVEKE